MEPHILKLSSPIKSVHAGLEPLSGMLCILALHEVDRRTDTSHSFLLKGKLKGLISDQFFFITFHYLMNSYNIV